MTNTNNLDLTQPTPYTPHATGAEVIGFFYNQRQYPVIDVDVNTVAALIYLSNGRKDNADDFLRQMNQHFMELGLSDRKNTELKMPTGLLTQAIKFNKIKLCDLPIMGESGKAAGLEGRLR